MFFCLPGLFELTRNTQILTSEADLPFLWLSRRASYAFWRMEPLRQQAWVEKCTLGKECKRHLDCPSTRAGLKCRGDGRSIFSQCCLHGAVTTFPAFTSEGGVRGRPLHSPCWEPWPGIWKTREQRGRDWEWGDLLSPDEILESERKI